jgi:hypothetical protein
MTIVSHRHRFIFLKTRKTAGSSIERWLLPSLGRSDMIATAQENWPVPVSFFSTPNPTTRFPVIEHRIKKWSRIFPGGPTSFLLGEHLSAGEVRTLVGDDTWRDYFKFCVERQPWDRVLSLWRWRQQRFKRSIPFDGFLDLLESSPDKQLVRHASNLDIYMIGKVIAVDQVVDFDRLNEDLNQIVDRLGMPIHGDTLPRVKSGIRRESDSVMDLTSAQIDRVSRLFAEEISLWGWQPPVSGRSSVA